MASGYFEANAGGNSSQQKWKLRLAYDYSTNTQGTQTTITWTLSIYDGTGDSEGTNSYWMTSYSGTRSAYYSYSSIGWYTLGSFTDTYSMTPGVARTITANAAWSTDNTGSSYTPPSISLSESLTFPAVGGTASISCSSGLVGGSVTASIGRKTTSFTYNLALTIGATTLTYSGINADSYAISLPTSLYNQFTTCTSRTCTITCKTMYGSTQIGDTQSANFTVGINTSANIPSISLSVYDSNSTTTALTGNSSKLIKGYSNAYCAISASATNGASVTGYTVKCADGKTFNGASGTLTGVESGSFTGYITDSRGLGNSTSVSKTIVDYIKLTLNPEITPPGSTDNTATVKWSGNFWNSNFGAVANTLTLYYRYKKDGGAYTSWTNAGAPTISGNTYTKTITIANLPYTSSYVFQLNATDKLNNLDSQEITVKTTPVFEIKKDDMAINVPLTVSEGITCNSATIGGHAPALQGAFNNLIASGNEFNLTPPNFSGDVYIGYRSSDGNGNSNITSYRFQNGKGGDSGSDRASVYVNTLYGYSAQAGEYHNGSGTRGFIVDWINYGETTKFLYNYDGSSHNMRAQNLFSYPSGVNTNNLVSITIIGAWPQSTWNNDNGGAIVSIAEINSTGVILSASYEQNYKISLRFGYLVI